MSKRKALEDQESVNKERKLSSTISSLSTDDIFNILQFVNHDLYKEWKPLKNKVKESNDDEHDKENETENQSLLSLMLVNSQWNQVLNSDEYYKTFISNFLSSHGLFYYKVPGYGNKTLGNYQTSIDTGIYKTWKEIFSNLFYGKFKKFNSSYVMAKKRLEEEMEIMKEENEEDEELPNLIEILERDSTLVIEINESEEDLTDSSPIGSSKFGGRPDLPDSCKWPTKKDDPSEFLIFVGQINLKDLKNCHAPKGVLPCTGWMYFFIEISLHGDYRSFYWNGNESELKRHAMPEKVINNYKSLKSVILTFVETVDYFIPDILKENDMLFTSNYTSRLMGHADVGELIPDGTIFLLQFNESKRVDIEIGDGKFYYYGRINDFCAEETKPGALIHSTIPTMRYHDF